jgi:DNA-binding transcriptional LysR family regulator
MDGIGWYDLKVFLALARTGSVRQAAGMLSISHSTVARRLTALKERLQVRLFDRLPNGYALNASGEQILEHAVTVEREILRIERSITGTDTRLSGPVQITLPPPISPLVVPMLARFKDIYPDIEIEILATYDVVDLSRRDADIAIRFFQEPEPWLVGRRLPKFANAAYASRDYVAQQTFTGPEPSARRIGWRGDGAWPEWVKDTDFPLCQTHWQINDPLVQMEAARASVGMALIPCWIGDRDPDLIRVPPGRTGSLRQAWILTHPDLRTSARVRAIVSFLATAIEAESAVLRGEVHGLDSD